MSEERTGAASQLRSFVIRSGRMTDAQRAAYEGDPGGRRVAPGAGFLDLDEVFGRKAPRVAEIGFGMGDATVEIAEANPGVDYLCIEVHRPGIGKLLMECERRGLGNVRVLEGDAIELLASRVPPDSLSGIHLFFPDPWPKKRHHKRRIVQPPFARLAASRLLPGEGCFHMATDWAEYAEDALAVLSAEPLLRNAAPGFFPRPAWRPMTKFESRALKDGRAVYDLRFVRT